MGGIQHFCCPLLVEIWCCSSVTRPLPLAFGHLIWRLRAQKWPLETVKRRENVASLATEASTKRRDTPSTDKRQHPVAFYQWNLLERQKPGIPLIKGIATPRSALPSPQSSIQITRWTIPTLVSARAGLAAEKTEGSTPKPQGARYSCDRSCPGQLELAPKCSSMP
jgi:hypothetical protein